MIKVSNNFFNNKELDQCLEMLSNCRAFTPIKALKILKFCKELQKHSDAAKSGFVKIAREFSKLDESGAPEGFKTGSYTFETKEKEEAFAKAFDEMIKAEIEIDVPSLNENDVAPAQLSPKHLGAIELFLTF